MSRLPHLLLLATASTVLASPAEASPNILLVIVDDLGVDKVSAYADDVSGYRTAATHLPDTATLDDLAASGLRFTAAWSNPLCSPTRAGILTGRHAFRTGVGYPVPIGPELDVDAETTLADILAARGYDTGLFGKWHLGEEGEAGTDDWSLTTGETAEIADTAHPLRAGFDTFQGSLWGQVEDYWSWTYVDAEPGYATLSTSSTYASWQSVDDALDWIAGRTEPWFATVALNAAHTDGDEHSYEADDSDDACHLVTCLADGTCDNVDKSAMQALAECMDAGMSELLAGIDPTVLAETLIVMVGDNGTESFVIEGDYASIGTRTSNGKATAYETGVRVPMIVTDGQNYLERLACEEAGAATCTYSTGLIASPGRKVESNVLTLDLFATLGGAGGATVTTGTDSVSFGSCFSNTSTRCVTNPSRTMYTEAFNLRDDGTLTKGVAALRVQKNKLVVNYDEDGACFDYELYNLTRDPFERRNLATAQPTTVSTLQATLATLAVPWMQGVATCTN